MDFLTVEEFHRLLGRQSGWSVSLFMPTHRAGRDTEQDPLRFKNLLRQVEQGLQARGMRTPDIQALLKPAQGLLLDAGFWMHQSDGLAVYLSPDTFRTYRLPLRFSELTVISERFYLKPLLPLFTGDGHFYILALSQNQVRLLEGTRFSVDEIELSSLPQSMAEALQYEHFEKQLQFHTRTPAGPGKRTAVFHGHDAGEKEKERILRWFHRIDEELPRLLGAEQSPLVLAGVEALFSIYRQANSYPHLLSEGVPGNPEALKPEELHARAWPLVQPIFAREQAQASTRFYQMADSDLAATDLKTIVAAAHHGRVETLFVAAEAQVWGRYDVETDAITTHPQAEPGDEDLLDLAALQTLLNGGVVYAVKPGEAPQPDPLAAILRY